MADERKQWQYRNPVNIYFGDHALYSLGQLVENVGSSTVVVLVTDRPGGSRNGYMDAVISCLPSTPPLVYSDVHPEPSQDDALRLLDYLRAVEATTVVGLGGGSVLDTCKVACALAPTQLNLVDVMDRRSVLSHRKIPFIALPTTAGSGSEVTPFAVLINPRTGIKQSLSSVLLYPEVAIVSPSFLVSVPRQVAGNTGMDALAHAMEALWSIHSNPASDALAYRSVTLIAKHFLNHLNCPEDEASRIGMATAATVAGMAFSNTFTAACHALSYPIGAEFNLPHGASCAITLDAVARLNETNVRDKFESLREQLQLPAGKTIPEFIRQLRRDVGTIPYLKNFKPSDEQLAKIAAGAYQPLLKNNPVALGLEELINFLRVVD